LDNATIQAVAMGIISACSLPLGALASFFWHPSERIIAFLMAFGGGALLAALTIDLVASALAKGEFYALAIGCVVGSVVFISLNQIINNKGGFLRKVSTTIYHTRRQRERRFRRASSPLGRVDVFSHLPEGDLKSLCHSVFINKYKKEAVIYRYLEPSDFLYIVEKGTVELQDPKNGMKTFQKISKWDAFGRI
jgi:zinc transporter ZupT